MNIGGRTINPGELRTSVVLESRTITTNAGGAQEPSYTTIATVWAKWTNVHGSEVWTAQAVQAVHPATVLIRYRSDINLACAVSKGSERFEIVSIDNIGERNEYLELKVKLMRNT